MSKSGIGRLCTRPRSSGSFLIKAPDIKRWLTRSRVRVAIRVRVRVGDDSAPGGPLSRELVGGGFSGGDAGKPSL